VLLLLLLLLPNELELVSRRQLQDVSSSVLDLPDDDLSWLLSWRRSCGESPRPQMLWLLTHATAVTSITHWRCSASTASSSNAHWGEGSPCSCCMV
jgi:hypothetical protein